MYIQQVFYCTMEENTLTRVKTAKSLKSAKSDRSKSFSHSKSPDKRPPGSAKTTVSSAKSAPKSAKSGKSKSPKRKSTAKSDHSSTLDEMLKSTEEYEDMSFQGLTIVSNKLFTSKFVLSVTIFIYLGNVNKESVS